MNSAAELRSVRPLPFTPADLPADKTLVRVVRAYMLAAQRGRGYPVETVLRELYPRDSAALALLRAASTPATTTQSSWADTIAATAVAAFIGSLKDNAAAELINAAPRVDLTGAARVALPTGAGWAATWVAEGGAIPVGQGVTGAPTLTPHKIATIGALTRESNESSPVGSEGWLEIILRDIVGAGLDQSLFSNTAGSALRPPGLVAGITALTPTAGGGLSACTGDFRLITDAIAQVAGGLIYYFMSPGRALAAKSLLPAIAGQIFGSPQIASSAMLGVAVGAFCSGFDGVPDLLVSQSATLHMEDSTPLAIGTPGSPPTVAAPARELFQTDSLALRLILRCGWALRVNNAAAWVSGSLTW